MHHIARPIAALFALAALAAPACASAPTSSDRDVQAALAVVHATIEARPIPAAGVVPGARTLVVVLSSTTPPDLRRASQALRPSVADVDLPDLDHFILPAGHLRPEVLEIHGDTAIFRGLLGPAPAPGDVTSSFQCGHHYTITLSRGQDGVWRVARASDELC